jgi:SAM-dependent methyltransferase
MSAAGESSVYSSPEYYEIAFSFRDSEHEVASLHAIAEQHSHVKVARVLELASGNAPHLPQVLARGWEYIGLDNSPAMLEYARAKAETCGGRAGFIQGELADFKLPAPVDLAFILVGSLYVESTAELNSHFDSVARALKPGGLYVLDRCIDFVPAADICETWEETRDGVTVEVDYRSNSLSRIDQTYEELLRLEVDDHGVEHTIHERSVKRAIYPQEFLLYMKQRPDFEFVGWWNDWDLDEPMEEAHEGYRPVAAVRRKDKPS